MAKHHRHSDLEITDLTVLVIVKIGTTDPATGNTYQGTLPLIADAFANDFNLVFAIDHARVCKGVHHRPLKTHRCRRLSERYLDVKSVMYID
ncbi:Uncharacterised protein [Tatumella ptyseos]|uniref:Uncharacterized protein n=1 Tax=Tatumella ptyseos TaxID=82987 RepID=A0A2X5NGS1_9GAMM|nr:Uncharacterised protein [Tatumella ptyseos]